MNEAGIDLHYFKRMVIKIRKDGEILEKKYFAPRSLACWNIDR